MTDEKRNLLSEQLDSLAQIEVGDKGSKIDPRIIANAKRVLELLNIETLSVRSTFNATVEFIYGELFPLGIVGIGINTYTLCIQKAESVLLYSYCGNLADPELEKHIAYFSRTLNEAISSLA